MKDKIAELLGDMKEEVLSELSSKQKKSARELLEDFEYHGKHGLSILPYESYFFKRKTTKEK